MKIFVLAGFSKSLVNFRKELLVRMVTNGHDVIAVGPENGYEEELKSIGIKFVQLKFERLAINPFKDIKFIFDLFKLMYREKPDVYFGYTIKPVIYGSIAARMAGIKNRFSMVTGLGSIFLADNNIDFIKFIVKMMYKMGFACNKGVIFQNPDDIKDFVRMKLIPLNKCYLVNGSGVNLEYYLPSPMPDEEIFLFVGSLMGDKGVYEYMKAASIVKKRNPTARFWIVGPMDKRLSGISELDIQQYLDEGCIEYYGAVQDVRPYYNSCRFYVLPSYREGTPRSVLEAMATGRPIITTDAPGCRETVKNNINGILVPIRNADMLASKMQWMIENAKEVELMGQKSLQLVREKYDVNKVNEYMLKIMQLES